MSLARPRRPRSSPPGPGTPSRNTLETSTTKARWAQLLARVFALDITRCRTCGGRMRVLEAVPLTALAIVLVRRNHVDRLEQELGPSLSHPGA